MDDILQVKDLRAYFYTAGKEIPAVDGVSFSVRRGETLCVVGESGCGKSATSMSVMQLIAVPPGKYVSGEILFEGQNLLGRSSREMNRIRGKDELTKEMAAVFDEEMYLKTHLDAKKFMKNLTGEAALRNWLWKPTLNIDGIWAGYTGPATKTVLPYHATCKIDVRLVPNMRADVMLQKIRNHLDKHGFSDITLTMRQGTQWSLVKGDCIPARACIEAMRHSGYPETTVWPIFPGSGPAYMFTDPPVSIPLVDYGLGISGQIHAPNEYFTVKGLRENEMSSAAFLFYLDKFVREEAEK